MKKALILLTVLAFAGCTSSAAVPGWYAGVPVDKLHVGMSQDEIVQVAGQPTHINRTTLEGLTREQWVYRDMWGGTVYLYLDNGTLRAWQN